jgi:hypothetical protein
MRDKSNAADRNRALTWQVDWRRRRGGRGGVCLCAGCEGVCAWRALNRAFQAGIGDELLTAVGREGLGLIGTSRRMV